MIRLKNLGNKTYRGLENSRPNEFGGELKKPGVRS